MVTQHQLDMEQEIKQLDKETRAIAHERLVLAANHNVPLKKRNQMEQKINSTVFDVASKSEVTLSKVFDFKPAESADQALTRIGGDSAKFLELINEGLRQHDRTAAANDPNIPWVDESGETFVGDVLTEEQSAKLNTTVLTMAKTMFGYVQGKTGTSEGRKKAKDEAQKFVLELPGFLEKLRG